MAITAQQVKELRDRTGVAMMACKKALEESDGDIEKAIEILRKRGESKAAEKATRSTSEGRVEVSGRAIVKILCETDFVGKNDKFITFTKELAKKIDKDGVVAGKEYFESVKTDKIQEIGENIVLDDISLLEGGDIVSGYVHSNGKIGVVVVLEGGTEENAKDLAMHAAAMNPSVANPEDVSAEEIEKEKSIYQEQLKNEGKPEQLWERIMEGKVKKFCAERALSSQSFVKDPSMTVAEFLGDAKLIGFIRMAI
ncbi:translation elongation factor Ts [Candidatus Gracilibacteria bacterium]|nr:translation elongation factor Ts [Candidatus Gracilibacteria bacterium]